MQSSPENPESTPLEDGSEIRPEPEAGLEAEVDREDPAGLPDGASGISPERDAMAWPPARWERPASAWRSDLWQGPEPVARDIPAELGPRAAERSDRRARASSMARELTETVLLTLVIFLAIRAVVQNFKIEGMSMEPNLHNGQFLLVNKLAYLGSSEPQRGDVVVFDADQWTPDKDFIKRIVGVPGERIEIRDDGVFINGVRLEEPYLDQTMYGHEDLELGPGEYYVMGDNRSNSSDSRNHGPLDREAIIGKAWLVYYPLRSAGLVDDAHEAFSASLDP